MIYFKKVFQAGKGFPRSIRTGWLLFSLIGLLGCGIEIVGRSDDNVKLPGVPSSLINLDSSTTTVRDLAANQFRNQSVKLQGQVGKQVPFLGSRAYELQDETGSVWVLTTRQTPTPGEQVLVRGKVRYQQITVGNQRIQEVYVEEQESSPRPSS